MRYNSIDKKYDTFILNIKEHFNNSKNITLFKQRNIVKIVEYNSVKYVVKSFKVPHILNRVVYNYFRASKAKRSYSNSLELEKLQINVPKPIAYIEFPSKFLFEKSYFISEFFDYDFEIRAIFNDEDFEDRETILKEFVKFSYSLHNKGVYHIDYSPGNVLIKRVDGEYIFYIIDVNRMNFINFDDAMRFKNLSRFSTSNSDLEFIAKEYASLHKIEEKVAIDTLYKYHNEHQKYLENKKRVKALRGKK